MRALVAALLPALTAAVLTRKGRLVERQPLVDPQLADYLGEDVREASKVMVLIPSLSESELVATLRAIFERARQPSRVHVGVVQQSSQGRQAGLETPLAARLCGALESLPDLQHPPEGGRQSLAACGPARRVRMYHVAAEQAKGPTDDRGQQQMLLGGGDEVEDFCMQIDTDAVFTPGWDEKAIRQSAETDNEYVVLPTADLEKLLDTSQYAPPRPGNSTNSWFQEAAERGSVPVIVPGTGRGDSCHKRWLSAFRDRLELISPSPGHLADNELVGPPRLRLHVSSFGGVGTTGIMHELLKLNPPIGTNHYGDLDKVKHIPFGDRIRRRAPDKMLYIYGDPVHAVISLDKRGWFHQQIFKVRSDPWPKGLSKRDGIANLSDWLNEPDDALQLERHFGSFYHQCEIPVAFLRIDEKTDHSDELAAFLETNTSELSRVLRPWRHARTAMDLDMTEGAENSTVDYDGLKDKIAEKLKGLISKFQAMPGFKTVIPGKDC